MITAEAFLAVEASLTKLVQKEAATVTKAVYAKVSEALSANDYQKAREELSLLNLGGMFAKNEKSLTYLTNVAMLFGASRVTQQPGTSVVGMGFEKLATQQLVATFLQMVRQKAEAYLIKAGTDHIDELESKSLESVQKANPYHDADGKFTTKEKSASGTPDAYKIYAKTVSSVAGWEKGSDYNGEVRLVPLSKIDTQPDEVWSEEYRRGAGQKTIDYLKKEAFGTVYEGGQTVGSNKLEALLVRSTDSGRYQLVDGQHRYNLLKQIGSSVAGVQVIGAVEKAERILRPFESFVDEAGQAYFNMVSSLHTSRVSAYGFTAEANVLGMEEYQINEQLDSRICPVCREMHGKTFKVSEARRLLEIVTRVSDPDDLKALQPWPKQNKDNLEKIREMTNAELVAQGWHIPPYHPGCRGLLGRVGKVPALDKVVAGQPEKYVASKDDFKTFKLPASDKQVALWNATVGLSPAEVFARMTGRTADELMAAALDSSDPKKEAGLYSVSIAKNITIRMTKEGFGSKNPFDQGLVFKTGQKELYIDSVELSGEDQASGVVKKYMREIYTLAKDAGATKLGLTAGLEVGGYAWAKYGFKPTIKAWETLKKDLYAKSAKLGYQTLLPEEKSKLLNALLSSDDPASIFTLSDTVGKELLLGSMWEGALDLADAESVSRFLSYIGELK